MSSTYYYIYIVVNRTVINSFPVSQFVTSMLFDQSGFFATTSYYNESLLSNSKDIYNISADASLDFNENRKFFLK